MNMPATQGAERGGSPEGESQASVMDPAGLHGQTQDGRKAPRAVFQGSMGSYNRRGAQADLFVIHAGHEYGKRVVAKSDVGIQNQKKRRSYT